MLQKLMEKRAADLKRKYNKNYYKKNPWLKSFWCAKYRCNDKNGVAYNRYGGRGIKVLMTKEDFKKLWFRDKAYLMKKPSIDRVDNDGNYEYKNCRFIEKSLNSYLGYSKQFRAVKQYDLKGKFIKNFKCIRDAERFFGIIKSYGNITNVCMGRRSIAYGYKWKYAN